MKKYLFLLILCSLLGSQALLAAPAKNRKFQNYEYSLTEERLPGYRVCFPDNKGVYHDENGKVISKAEAIARNNKYLTFYGEYNIDWPEYLDGYVKDKILRVLRKRLYSEDSRYGSFDIPDDGETDLDEIIMTRFGRAIDEGFPGDKLSMKVIPKTASVVEVVVLNDVGLDLTSLENHPKAQKFFFSLDSGEQVSEPVSSTATRPSSPAPSATRPSSPALVQNVSGQTAGPSDTDIEKNVKRLWDGIPDHGLKPKTRGSFTKNFYDLINVGFTLPSDDPGGIGSEDFLWYWYTDQEAGPNPRITRIQVDGKSNQKIDLTVFFDDDLGYGTKPHKMVLVTETRPNRNGQKETRWVIGEFDNMRDEIYKYLREFAPAIKNGSFTESVLRENSGWMSASDIREYRESVSEFIELFNKTYPTGDIKR